LAIYSPECGVFFVKEEDLSGNGRGIKLRLTPAKNRQFKKIRMAELYRSI